MTHYHFDHANKEKHWRKAWNDKKIYRTSDDQKKPKYYSLGMFPYPSGNAHMGHVRVYTLTDLMARFKRMKGFNVLNPIGWDAFGLPAENAAKKHGVDPAQWTKSNIQKMRDEQIGMLGFSFDWDREINTSSADYYKWTQWLFIQLFNNGLVEKRLAPCNWCPTCQTVLANEQVVGGGCWRCDSRVEQKELEQWFIKISKYAEELYDNLDNLKGWPDSAIGIQREWIGKKNGTVVDFKILGKKNGSISVFTTRADTLFGVSAIVIAYDHPEISKLAEGKIKQVEEFCFAAKQQTEIEAAKKEDISGFLLDIKVEHPFTKEKIPVYVGDYVLSSFGTGAVMCVPAHDKRDFRFARKYGLAIKPVINSVMENKWDYDEDAFVDKGVLANSSSFSGLSSDEAIKKIGEELELSHLGRPKTFFRLKDWCISRQRAWGAPIPLKLKNGQWEPFKVEDLPFTLEQSQKWANLGKYETETMDTFMCSSWYFYRFLDPHNDEEFAKKEYCDYWMPIDFYVGAIEHAAQHLIYARFIAKFLNDIGRIKVREPVEHYLVNGFVKNKGRKMSKSKGNEVVPTEVVEKYGADALRMFILGDYPPDFDIDWSDAGLEAKRAFLDRVYLLFKNMPKEIFKVKEELSKEDRQHPIYAAVQNFLFNVQKNIEVGYSFNNVISQYHIYFNFLSSEAAKLGQNGLIEMRRLINFALKSFLLGLAPVVPFITEDLWHEYDFGKSSIHLEHYPEIDTELLQRQNVAVAVQINGKLADVLQVSPDTEDKEVESLAKGLEKVALRLEGKKIKKVIVVKNRIVNFVVA